MLDRCRPHGVNIDPRFAQAVGEQVDELRRSAHELPVFPPPDIQADCRESLVAAAIIRDIERAVVRPAIDLQHQP